MRKKAPTIHSKEKYHRTYGIKNWIRSRLKRAQNATGGVRATCYEELINGFCEAEEYFDNPRLKGLSKFQRKELFVSNRFAKFCSYALKHKFDENKEELVAEVQDKTKMVLVEA